MKLSRLQKIYMENLSRKGFTTKTHHQMFRKLFIHFTKINCTQAKTMLIKWFKVNMIKIKDIKRNIFAALQSLVTNYSDSEP